MKTLTYSLLLLYCFAIPVFAGDEHGVYQKPKDFVSEVFAGEPPKPKSIFFKGELKAQVKKLLGHKYKSIRVKYWQADGRSAWVLEEIGKEQYITMGFVIDNDAIEKLKILVFRETRGWEVRHDFFTDQFIGAELGKKDKLTQHIDNISGATLSTRATKKMGRLALFLHRHITVNGNTS